MTWLQTNPDNALFIIWIEMGISLPCAYFNLLARSFDYKTGSVKKSKHFKAASLISVRLWNLKDGGS